MRNQEYIRKALATEPRELDPIKERLNDSNIRLLHAAMGVSTESAEILDVLKKHIFYGKPLDKENLFEEAGDLFWYLAILSDELGFSFKDCMDANIEKLKLRYGNKFSETKAINR